MPEITIIIPVYKVEAYLKRCLDSLLTQSFTDWEMLLIDDGSPDKSGEICDAYAQKDERIKVVHKKNGGVSSARNAGLDIAKGKWVVFVDSDDWCEANYLADFFNDGLDLQDEDIVLQGRKNEIGGKVTNALILKDGIYQNVANAMLENDLLTFGAPYCKLYSNRVIQKYGIRFPEAYSYGEDTTFFFHVLSVTKRIITTSRCNYHYVDSYDGSLSKKNHDFALLAAFLKDSMELVKQIDENSAANGKLVKAYMPNYKNLLLRSIVNMYRLRYSAKQKKECYSEIKKECLPSNSCIEFAILRYVPISFLNTLFGLIILVRKK